MKDGTSQILYPQKGFACKNSSQLNTLGIASINPPRGTKIVKRKKN
ncbi:unnamed protein product [Ixodes persulcatus]